MATRQYVGPKVRGKNMTLKQKRVVIQFMDQHHEFANEPIQNCEAYIAETKALWEELKGLVDKAARDVDEHKQVRQIQDFWKNTIKSVKRIISANLEDLSMAESRHPLDRKGRPLDADEKIVERILNLQQKVEENVVQSLGIPLAKLQELKKRVSNTGDRVNTANQSTKHEGTVKPKPHPLIVRPPIPNRNVNEIIGSSICRTCLIPITNESHSITAEHQKLYHQITGYNILPTDHLKQICASCNDILEKVQQFKLKAERAESTPWVVIPKTFLLQNSVSSKYNRDNDNRCGDFEDLEHEADSKINDKLDNIIASIIDIEASPSLNETVDNIEPYTNQIHKENDFEDKSKDRSRKLLEINQTEIRRRRGMPCIDEETRDELYSQSLSVDGRKKYIRPFHRDLNAPKPKYKYNQITSVCDLRGRKFLNRWTLNNHRATVHLKDLNLPEYECDLCGVKIGSKATLDYHFRKRHIQRPCPECGKIYTTTSGLKCHREAIHWKTEKNLICEICGKAFNTHKYLRAHRTTHNPSYPCPMCPQVLVAAASLRSHIKLKHKEIQQPPPGTVLKNYDWTKQVMQESE